MQAVKLPGTQLAARVRRRTSVLCSTHAGVAAPIHTVADTSRVVTQVLDLVADTGKTRVMLL